MKKESLLLFPSTRALIKAEEILRAAGMAVEIVTVPDEVSSDCGMCVRTSEEDCPRAFSLVSDAGVTARVFERAPREEPFDLLSTVEQGGCSAKLHPGLLSEAVKGFARPEDSRLLVGLDTCDDAGVYQLTDEIALIETTDFFPPICSDAFEFGQISAANALSDVYAMGGRVLTAMNLVMFPDKGIPLGVLREILRGGQEKVREAGGMIVGGHTIVDPIPKYGLAVSGVVHPGRVVTNSKARVGDILVLTKPLGTGAVVAGKRQNQVSSAHYRAALDSMKLLNRAGSEIMQAHGIRAATDITGFGLLGHAMHIARASNVTLEIHARVLPALPGAIEMLEFGCIPGGSYRNQEYVEGSCSFDQGLPYPLKMLALDPQTSGGLLMCVSPPSEEAVLCDLRQNGFPWSASIGKVVSRDGHLLRVVGALSPL